MRPSTRSRGVPSFALMMLLNELIRTATNSGIPPVTCATIAAQILLFLRIIKLPWQSVWDVCLSVEAIINKKKYLRLILSQLEHADDWHLYYNMVSFLWKGRTLERQMGSIKFAITLFIFTISTSVTYIILNILLANITDDRSYVHTCAVGFSGVIFALKVLTTHYNQMDANIMGIPIGSKYAVWAELALIQMISPNASFVGHLAGILVGLAYVNGPLKYLVDLVSNTFENTGNNSRNQSRRFNSAQNTGYARNYQNYFPSEMSEEEQLRRATEESMFSSTTTTQSNMSYPTAPPYPTEDNYSTQSDSAHSYPQTDVDAETLRRLRLRHYQTDSR